MSRSFHGASGFAGSLLVLAGLFVASAIWPYRQLGSEFMPPLDEGDLLYMPTTDPSISVTKARQVLQQTDKLIKTFPEVVSVYGKMGRAESATDPAPLDMVETVVRLNTDPATWRTPKRASLVRSRRRTGSPGRFITRFWPEQRAADDERTGAGMGRRRRTPRRHGRRRSASPAWAISGPCRSTTG